MELLEEEDCSPGDTQDYAASVSLAQSVTSENMPIRVGVVRAMASSDR